MGQLDAVVAQEYVGMCAPVKAKSSPRVPGNTAGSGRGGGLVCGAPAGETVFVTMG